MLTPILSPSLSSLSGVRHGFFTREGGVSKGAAFASLNCSFSQDDCSLVCENRRLVAQHLLSLESNLFIPSLCHGTEVVRVDGTSRNVSATMADAVVTTEPGLAIGVLSADCAPILLADASAGVVAAVHAGWRGALGGVLENTVSSMKECGASEGRIVAAVGPCIRQEWYEVGPEFEERFLSEAPWSKQFFAVPAGGRKAHFNLPGFVMATLQRLGVASCEDLNICTRAEDRFFSYRRHTAQNITGFGCQASAILLA